MTMAAIELSDVTVRFPVYGSAASPAAGSAAVGGTIGRARRGPVYVEALRSVSLRLDGGDRLGLVGHNGCGKSTLLRIMAGVYAPCLGSVHVRGRVLSLFEPMLGMSLDCSGRDNIVLRAIYMGLAPRDALTRMEEIAEFSELGDYLDLPLKSYSLGMQVRLAFAVVTAFDAEVLLLDEQLVAGDAAFAEKAERRLKGFLNRAGIVVQASHSERLIRETCDRVGLLEHGRVSLIGTPDEVFARYRALGGAAHAG